MAHEIRIYGELHRFIPVLAHARGFRITELPVNHRERQFGHSKYGIKRFLRGFLDLCTVKFLTGYGQRPQHLMGGIGLTLFGLGGLGMTWLVIVWLRTNVLGVQGLGDIGTRPLLAYSIASLLLGAQAVSLGFVAELLVSYTGKDLDTYSFAERSESASNSETESIVV